MSNLVIVAIPEQDDYVWKISSEKVPHLTICYLGNPSEATNVVKMADFLEHAANTMLTPFYLDVSERGTLGADDADVIFFDGFWDLPEIKRFRAMLLQDENIRKAYDSTDQHDEWLPHLTLGYPDSPAKPDNRDYPGIHSVRFNKVALWFGDFEGVEFKLKSDFDKYPMEALSMNDARRDAGLLAVTDILAHHGVKGMKWGVRKERSSTITVHQKGKKLTTEGGHAKPAHEDATRVAAITQKAKVSGMHSLSNDELKIVRERLNLEQNVRNLQQNQPGAKNFIKNLLRNVGKQQAGVLVSDVASASTKKATSRGK